MGDGAMCHYCRKYECECPPPQRRLMLTMSAFEVRVLSYALDHAPTEETIYRRMKENDELEDAQLSDVMAALQRITDAVESFKPTDHR